MGRRRQALGSLARRTQPIWTGSPTRYAGRIGILVFCGGQQRRDDQTGGGGTHRGDGADQPCTTTDSFLTHITHSMALPIDVPNLPYS